MSKPQKQHAEDIPPGGQVTYETPTGQTYKRKLLNPDLISLAHTPHIFVEVLALSYRMKAEKLSRSEDGAITVYEVSNLGTGEVGLLMATTVLESTLEKIEGGYVGKKFEILAKPASGEKNYTDVKVWELT